MSDSPASASKTTGCPVDRGGNSKGKSNTSKTPTSPATSSFSPKDRSFSAVLRDSCRSNSGQLSPHGNLSIGQEVTVAAYNGTIRYLGTTQFATGKWVGVELDEPVGKNSGSIHDIEYFTCKPMHGVFVREAVVAPRSSTSADGEKRKTDSEQHTLQSKRLSDASVESVDSDDGEPEIVVQRFTSERRRYGISAGGGASPLELAQWQPPLHPKSGEERQQLMDLVRNSHDSKLQLLFGCMTAEGFERIVGAMFSKPVDANEKLIEIGDSGDFLYIVKTGKFDIFARRQQEQPLVKVFEACTGNAFGELALLHDAPRSATVIATQASEVWCLDRETFRRLLVQSSQEHFQERCAFLRRCDIFRGLDEEKIAALAEVLEEEDFVADEAIITQGDRDNKMYMIRKGEAVACIKGDRGEVEVMRYGQGGYFGEIALLHNVPRKASVYSLGPSTCFYIAQDTFHRLLGYLQDDIKREIGTYRDYTDSIASAHAVPNQLEVDSTPMPKRPTALLVRQSRMTKNVSFDESREGDEVLAKNLNKVGKSSRSRTLTWSAAQELAAYIEAAELELQEEEEAEARKAAEAEAAASAVAASAAAAAAADAAAAAATAAEMAQTTSTQQSEVEPEEVQPPLQRTPTTLAMKVELDFKRPELVEPTADFTVHRQDFGMFGGLRPGEKFTVNKAIVARGRAKQKGGDDADIVYKWRGPCWLKGCTNIAVLCQKGQKSPDDPTPNQDNYFVLQLDNIGIYGVCDGHGPFGHLVSFRLVQTLPHFLTANKHFGQDWASAMKEAFLSAQQDLLDFGTRYGVNLEASGAAGSMLVSDGPSVHIAHIGDAGALVASWNRHQSRLICSTKDHKPQDPEERMRLEAAGSEVREVDPGSFRIYQAGSVFPGLTMSRAFGDTACAGVLQEPSYQQFFMQPEDEFYAIIASDGIWEFIDYEKAVELSAKKLRLKGPHETLSYLTQASRKRWAYCCGDYCDDITAVLIQWNAKDKSDENYTVFVTAPL